MPKEYLNFLNLNPSSFGNERRYEMLNDIVRGGTFLPNPVEYRDIDESFRDWVKSLKMISDEGKEYPTMTLFSNQRFSEYSQSWQYVDENKNLLLNFKTITRENNPQYGQIQNGLWNVPGERFYTMKKKRVLDNNGTESFLVLKMRQPVAIDFQYKLSIFTTKYTAINEFNTLINKAFAARQCYISPKGHFMPMILNNISDESQYNINDRQFYSQTYQIKVLGYIITAEDFRVEEIPLKVGGNLGMPMSRKKKVEIELEEMEYTPLSYTDVCGSVKKIYVPRSTGEIKTVIDIDDITCDPEDYNKFYYKPITMVFNFGECNDNIEVAKISCLPTDFVVTNIKNDNRIKSITITVDGAEVPSNPTVEFPLIIRKGSNIKVHAQKGVFKTENLQSIWSGYSPLIVYSEDLDDMESELDEMQEEEIIEFDTEE